MGEKKLVIWTQRSSNGKKTTPDNVLDSVKNLNNFYLDSSKSKNHPSNSFKYCFKHFLTEWGYSWELRECALFLKRSQKQAKELLSHLFSTSCRNVCKALAYNLFCLYLETNKLLNSLQFGSRKHRTNFLAFEGKGFS